MTATYPCPAHRDFSAGHTRTAASVFAATTLQVLS
jgi:hypothetical protein